MRDVVLYVRWSFHGFLRRVAVSLPGVTINNDSDGVVAVAFWKFNHEIGGDTFPWHIGCIEQLKRSVRWGWEHFHSLTGVARVDIIVYKLGHAGPPVVSQ